MSRLVRFTVLALALFMVAATVYAGGWSVITVTDVPDHGITGKVVTLTFSVRQHGKHLVSGLQPDIRATTPHGLEVTAAASPTANKGEYTATMIFPQPGDWTIRIDGGFNPSDKSRIHNSVTLPPLKIVGTEGSSPVPAPTVTRGERLFVTKGCVGCHSVNAERDLTGKRFSPDYLKVFLANPAIRKVDMPNLDLKEDEIAALVAFINR